MCNLCNWMSSVIKLAINVSPNQRIIKHLNLLLETLNTDWIHQIDKLKSPCCIFMFAGCYINSEVMSLMTVLYLSFKNTNLYTSQSSSDVVWLVVYKPLPLTQHKNPPLSLCFFDSYYKFINPTLQIGRVDRHNFKNFRNLWFILRIYA